MRYYPSPGFVGEWMQIFLAEGLTAGDATPEEDEEIEIFLMPLSEVLKMIDKGEILDGKTLIAAQMYARTRRAEEEKAINSFDLSAATESVADVAVYKFQENQTTVPCVFKDKQVGFLPNLDLL